MVLDVGEGGAHQGLGFTGDLGTRAARSCAIRSDGRRDWLITESTYGDRARPPEQTHDRLAA